MNIGVTGANGYIGGAIAKYLRREGHNVYEFKRTSDQKSDPFWVPYELSAELKEDQFKKIDGLIHCAYDFKPTTWKEIHKINVEGSCRLFRTARRAGVSKIIFISSMSAFNGAKSMYGKAKLEIEQEALRNGILIARPGLVFGTAPGGMVGSLLKTVSSFAYIPLISGGRQIFYLCHEEDLFSLSHQYLKSEIKVASKPIIAANNHSLSFKRILEILAEYKNKRISFFSIPRQPLFLALKTAELFRVPITFRSDSLISFLNQDPNPNFNFTNATHVNFREFNVNTLKN